MSRFAARVALALITVGALALMALVEIHVDSRLWPFVNGHRTSILLLAVGIVCWVGGSVLALYFGGWALVWLWRKAEL